MSDESELTEQLGAAGKTHFSLFELFFVVTLIVVELGVYIHLSRLVAFLAACALLVYAAIKLSGVGNFVAGGIGGYLVASTVMWAFVATCGPSLTTSVAVWLFCPAIGYVVGAFLAEVE